MWLFFILVAGPRFARGSQGYEPCELLLLYPAITTTVLHINITKSNRQFVIKYNLTMTVTMYIFLLNFLTTLLSVGIFKLMQFFQVGNSDFERGVIVFSLCFVISFFYTIYKYLSVKNVDEFLSYTVYSLFLEGGILLIAIVFVYEPALVFRINQSILGIVASNFVLFYIAYSIVVKFLSSRVFAVPFITIAISIPIALVSFNGFANYFVLLKGGAYTEFFTKELIMSILSFDLPVLFGVIFYSALGYILLRDKRF